MAIGKVVVITGGTDKEQMAEFLTRVPSGWKPIIIDQDEGEARITRELEDAEYLLRQGGRSIPAKFVENAKKLKLMQTGGQGTDALPVEYALNRSLPLFTYVNLMFSFER
jgi:phosphoglycerate dehydrogenase-like enzyme